MFAAGESPEGVGRLEKVSSNGEDGDGCDGGSVSDGKKHFDFGVAGGVFDGLHRSKFVSLLCCFL